jgi:hypothetical protein
LGAHHDYKEYSGGTYEHGFYEKYCDAKFLGICVSHRCVRTIMTYTRGECYSEPAILQYSNILNKHNGRWVGTSTRENNGRKIRETAQSIANMKTAKVKRTVELCKHSTCEGGTYRAAHTIGNWPSMPADIGNGQLTKVIIPQGLSFEYFQHGAYGGYFRAYGSKTAERIINMGSNGHNDAVSSFKVRQIPAGSVKLCRDYPCGTGPYYYASVGSWSSMPWQIGNDALSYVYVPKGYKATFFEHNSYGGCRSTLSSPDGNRAWYFGGSLDNKVSSFIVSVL